METLIGEQKYCLKEELAREVLLQYIREVEGPADVTVQTMTGRSFDADRVVVLELGAELRFAQT